MTKWYRGKKTEKGSEISTNDEIYTLYGELTIKDIIRSKILQWLEHMEIMDPDRDVEDVAQKPGRKYKTGRDVEKLTIAENKQIEDRKRLEKTEKTRKNGEGIGPRA
ncbi:hypothetical protein WA026_014083 [Henosepilachna vigintioctopunctata]|uniref:Uncharacterized protein n=1 Tax=Henosepilachna vigintioctopunctata TaxID=420089 RepID=A0AAW1U6T0_9CUCU